MPGDRDPNIYEPGTESRGIPGYASLRRRVGDEAGSRRIGTSTWHLPPGQGAYPFHFHYVEEEQLIVLEGRPALREAGGWRRLERGAVVVFHPGEAGAHQVHNDTDEPVLLLSVSTSGEPDIVVYPDVGRLGVFERPPGDGQLWKLFALDQAVEYGEDHAPPQPPPGL